MHIEASAVSVAICLKTMLDLLLSATKLLNAIVVAGILITAFALVVYIALYNRRSGIGRGFAILLCCVIGAYLFELLAQISTNGPFIWLRAQWLGLALMPAAALSLSDVLLRATADVSPTRRYATYVSFVLGTGTVILMAFTELIATPGISSERLPHLTPGPLFGLFGLFYFMSAGWAMYNVIEARRRALTATTRRRMTYFVAAFAAPLLGIFPYLLPTGWPAFLPLILAWLAILTVNMCVGAAITFMGYTVAYFGAGAPDRVIKRRLVKYLIRGPLLAAMVIASIVLASRVERMLGLPGSYIGLILAATIILLTQLYIVTFQPTLDRLIAGEDTGEVARLQHFSDRLMTTSDLHQYLENILAALCDLLRARSAFVMQINGTGSAEGGLVRAGGGMMPLLVTIGTVELEQVHLPSDELRSLITGKVERSPHPPVESTLGPDSHALFANPLNWNGYWLFPLTNDAISNDASVLGVMGLMARTAEPDLTGEERQGVDLLMKQAARALNDAITQQRAFDALERIVPEASDMTARMSSVRNPGAPTVADFELVPKGYDDLTHLVRDALSQFWGGPKLAESPLMSLQVVADAMKDNSGNTTRALRAVLLQAIGRLKPDGVRSFTAAEWTLYNILELKIVQNEKVRDVASKLFMSESDLYRKQKNAFEEVARVVKEMEREARTKEPEANIAQSQPLAEDKSLMPV